MRGKTTPIDGYLARVGDEQRAALERLRRTIRAVAPQAEEVISYGIPTFRLNGRGLVGFGASSEHCALYPLNGTTVAAFAEELEGYDVSKGTIRFRPERPLPIALVKKLVKARIVENARRGRR